MSAADRSPPTVSTGAMKETAAMAPAAGRAGGQPRARVPASATTPGPGESGAEQARVEPLGLTLDRDLPLPLGVQLRGQIEYGIATGEIPRGIRLPSVRELARQLRLAPVTVARVYKELREQGLLESRQGRGTFVPERLPPEQATESMAELGRAVEAFFASAGALGFSRVAAAEAATLRASRPPSADRTLRVLLVGIFPDASRAYAEAIRRHLPPGDTIAWATFDTREAGGATATGGAADVYVTLANREGELRALVGDTTPVLSLTFIPSLETRTRLAEVPSDARVAVVASIPEFLPTLRRNVSRCCPHVRQLEAVPLAARALARVLSRSTVVVYATGTREVLSHLPRKVDAFEFRYEPEVGSIRRLLLPTLESVRQERVAKELET